MTILFKAEIEIDREKFERDYKGKHTIEDAYYTIEEFFKDNGCTVISKDDEIPLICGTDKHEKFGDMLVAINTTYLSELKPYLKKFIWYNNEDDTKEDVLATFKKCKFGE